LHDQNNFREINIAKNNIEFYQSQYRICDTPVSFLFRMEFGGSENSCAHKIDMIKLAVH